MAELRGSHSAGHSFRAFARVIPMTAAANNQFPWHAQLPRLGPPEEFAALRRLLEQVSYSEEGICRRLGLERFSDYAAPPIEEVAAIPVADSLDTLIRLFIHSVFVDEASAARLLPSGGLALLESLGLVARHASHPGLLFGASTVLPVDGLLMVCDHGECAPDGSECELPPDVVYPPVFRTTRRFLDSLPVSGCDAMLDLATGTGVAAIVGARVARHVWATDISHRAALAAEFNRRLAAIGNMTVLAGDLYAPVEGLTFDRIVIHPPYVPAQQSEIIFRDGGEDGEQVIRRAVEGLPRFLRAGGRFYSVLMASDRVGESFEQRMRKWMGSQESEFDIAVTAYSIEPPGVAFGNLLRQEGSDLKKVVSLSALWSATRTEAIVYAAVVIERHDVPRPAVTKRVQVAES